MGLFKPGWLRKDIPYGNTPLTVFPCQPNLPPNSKPEYLIPQTHEKLIIKYPEKSLKYFLKQTLAQKINN